MKRRVFFDELFKYTIGATGLIVAPNSIIAKRLELLLDSEYFEPYLINVDENGVRIDINSVGMPKAVVNKAIQITPSKKIWLTGEAKDHLSRENRIVNIAQSIGFERNSKAYTPVSKLINVVGGHEVYGQWFKVRKSTLKGLIRGFDGRFYSVHSNMKNIFTNTYHCYGLPAANYVVPTCNQCGLQYIYQDFRESCNSNLTRLYSWHDQCTVNRSGMHDNLRIRRIEPCGTSDKFDIGEKF